MRPWREKYRCAYVAWHLCTMCMALHIGAVVYTGGSPITPELYGPIVYYVPALAWVVAQVAITVLGVLGTLYYKWMMAVSGALGVVLYSFFGAAASLIGEGMIVIAGALWVFVPVSILTLVAGLGGNSTCRRT